MTTTAHHRQASAGSADEALHHAASVLDVDLNILRALRVRSPYREVPVRLWLMGEEPIRVSTQKQADELRAVDRSCRLVTR